MDFLNDYRPLHSPSPISEVKQDTNHTLNILNVTSIQSMRIKRLISGRLGSSNLAFTGNQSFNHDAEFLEVQKQKQALQHNSNKNSVDIQDFLNFSLITKTHQPDYEIFISFSINVKRATINFESKILKNYKILKVESTNLTKFIGKYFLSFNSKLRQGSFFINPITTQISMFIRNNSTLQSISTLIRNPQKFLVYLMFYIDQITSKWNQCLDSILYLANKKSYQEIVPTKKFRYVNEKISKLGQMIIQSHIDASFFIQNRGISRFQKITEEQRKHKVAGLKNQFTVLEKRSKTLQVINPLLALFIERKKMSNAQFKFIPWQMQQIRQISQNLACHQYVGRSKIYSEIQILSLINEMCVFQSGFSKIYQIQAQIKRQEDPTPTKAILVKKQTQQKRYQNQVSVLKLIQKQKFLFLPRYYFCQQEEYKKFIFIQFIPEASLDRYLLTKSFFLGIQTKLFFLFMIIVALRFLRDNSIVHIDLKPENVLIKIVGDAKRNVHYLVKLIDFGESYSPKIDLLACNLSRGFTIPYAPPELLSKNKRFDQKADVYSLGVMMLKIIFNHFPAEIMRLNKMDFIDEKYLKFYSIPKQKFQFYGISQLMSLLYYLCLKCVQPNPNERPTLDWLCIILKDIILTYDELAK